VIKKSKRVQLEFNGSSFTFGQLQDFFYACLALDPEDRTEVQLVISIMDCRTGVLCMDKEDE
jgi:hypothetical protein